MISRKVIKNRNSKIPPLNHTGPEKIHELFVNANLFNKHFMNWLSINYKWVLDDYKIQEDTIKDIESDIKKQIKDVEKFSLESPLPDLKELYTEVYL
mgnify:CR=1 FL=1